MVKTWIKHKALEKAIHTMFNGWTKAICPQLKRLEDEYKLNQFYAFIATKEEFKECTIIRHIYNCSITAMDLPFDLLVKADTYYKFLVIDGVETEKHEIHNANVWIDVKDITQKTINFDFHITT